MRSKVKYNAAFAKLMKEIEAEDIEALIVLLEILHENRKIPRAKLNTPQADFLREIRIVRRVFLEDDNDL